MEKTRVVINLDFAVDLDPIPGTYHQAVDWITWINNILEQHSTTYRGKVLDAAVVGEYKTGIWKDRELWQITESEHEDS